jgi:hypothetical protein
MEERALAGLAAWVCGDSCASIFPTQSPHIFGHPATCSCAICRRVSIMWSSSSWLQAGLLPAAMKTCNPSGHARSAAKSSEPPAELPTVKSWPAGVATHPIAAVPNATCNQAMMLRGQRGSPIPASTLPIAPVCIISLTCCLMLSSGSDARMPATLAGSNGMCRPRPPPPRRRCRRPLPPTSTLPSCCGSVCKSGTKDQCEGSARKP